MLTIHIVVSVGLLGDSAGFLAVAIRRATSDDPAFVDAAHDLLGMFALLFGIPLSFLTLLTGVALGLGTPWGVFRYPWVVVKLVLRRRSSWSGPRSYGRCSTTTAIRARPRSSSALRRTSCPHRRHRARGVQAGTGTPADRGGSYVMYGG